MPTLRELQATFAAGLRAAPPGAADWVVGDGIAVAARLGVYRNNSRSFFEQALQQTYPVLRRRVGDDYFGQLAHFYRRDCPSRAGDLHEVGRRFAAFLAGHLDHGPYAWLAELARLEWAVADAAVAADSDVAGVTSLAGLAPEVLARVRLHLVPSLHLVAATMPVLGVWQANQAAAPACTVDLSTGPQYIVVHRAPDGVQLREVGPRDFALLAALQRGHTLVHALEESGLPADDLPRLLYRLFADAAVAAVSADADPDRPLAAIDGSNPVN